MGEREYDLIVIGGGAVGENVADRAVRSGLSAVIVESELVGGECSYWACMPTKALLRSGIALRAATSVGGAREAVTGELDVAAVLDRRDRFASNWDDAAQVSWMDGVGIDLVRGHGSIVGEREVQVTTDTETVTLRARHAVAVCTGTSAAMPDVPGLAEVAPWTSREAASAPAAPQSLAIVGGGVIAAEMATAFAEFGTQVTMLVRSRLLSGNEPFAGKLVTTSLTERGVQIITGVELTRASRDTDGQVALAVSNGETVRAEQVLIATGRAPNTRQLGLESAGLTPGDWITVDDTMRVPSTDWLYAVGDVNHRALLTHQGKYQARAAGDAIVARATGSPVDQQPWGTHVAAADHRSVPQVTFTDPEVASVGLTAAAAERAGLRIRVLDYPIGRVAGASLHADGYRGHARAVVDEDRGVLVGATLVGPDVAELLHAATVAVVGEVPIDRLWHAVPAYPTISEIWLRLLEEYGRPT